MKAYQSKQLGLISANPSIISLQNFNQEEDSLSLGEAKVVAFYPTLVTLIGFEYLKALIDKCIKIRSPYTKEIRIIKQNMNEYMSRSFFLIKDEDKSKIRESVECCVDRADSSIDNLWNTTKRVILKVHPDMDENMVMITTNGIISILFIRMAIKVAQYCEIEVERRTNVHHESLVDIYSVNIINACSRIIKRFDIPCTPMMKRSTKAIAKRVADELKLRIKKGDL